MKDYLKEEFDMQEKVCESCGMPMVEASDFGGGNTENKYCKYCTNETGELKDFETKLKDTIHFMISRMNVDPSVAEKLARETLAKMPAWAAYF